MKLVREKVFGLSSQTKNISVVISCEYFCLLTIQSYLFRREWVKFKSV